MKATELLRRYQAGERDFKSISLRGQNLKGQDLSGADFSGADIRSTNFTNANLTGANFTQAEAGLQWHWTIGLLVISSLLAIVSGVFLASASFWVLPVLDFASPENQIAAWTSLLVITSFQVLLIFRGLSSVTVTVIIAITGSVIVAIAIALAATVIIVLIVAIGPQVVIDDYGGVAVIGSQVVDYDYAAVAIAVAVAVTVVAIVTIAVAVAVAVAGAITNSKIGSIVVAIFGSISVTVGGYVGIRFTFPGSASEVIIGAIPGFVAATVMFVSSYIGWRAFRGDERDAWIRSIALVLAATGGTSFFRAILTNAVFVQACLMSADFRQAQLICTHWKDALKLNWVRPGETYLNNRKIQNLLLTGEGQGQSFDYLLNLQGINLQGANLDKADFSGSNLSGSNLQGANLINASFIGASLNGAYLQDSDLSNTKLVQTQLDEADLTGATLTGSCIEDWNITTRTKLNGICCDYVFMRLLSDRRPDQNPRRKPDDWDKTFAEGEFVDFITPMIETLDLYHNQTVNPRALAIAFSELQQQNPDAELDIISMEKRGQNRDKFLLRATTTQSADLSQLHSQYFDCYDHLLTLPTQTLIALLIEKEDKAQMLAGMVGTAINRSGTHINIYNNQGDTTVAEQGSNAPKYDMRGAQFAGGFAEKVEGDQVGGTINNSAAATPSLAEAAAEIQSLLKQLEAANPTATEADQTAYLNALIPPTRRERFIGALRAAGDAAIDEVPYLPVLKALVEGWQQPS